MPESKYRVTCPAGCASWDQPEWPEEGTLRCPRCYETFPLEEFGVRVTVKPPVTPQSKSVEFDCPKGLHGHVVGLHLGNNDFICPGCYREAVKVFKSSTRPAIRHVPLGVQQIFRAAGIDAEPRAKPNHSIDITLFKEERRAIGVLASELARRCQEDLIGAILMSGAFHELENREDAIVDLADKLEAFLPRDHEFRQRAVKGHQEQAEVVKTKTVMDLKRENARLRSERHGNGTLTCQICGVLDREYPHEADPHIYLESAEMFLCPPCVGETEEEERNSSGFSCDRCGAHTVRVAFCAAINEYLCPVCKGSLDDAN